MKDKALQNQDMVKSTETVYDTSRVTLVQYLMMMCYEGFYFAEIYFEEASQKVKKSS